MAGGGAAPAPTGVSIERAQLYKGRVTPYVITACLIAAVGGSIFGYDIGISGGVTSMDPFLEKFFPVVYRKKNNKSQNNYCKYDNQGLSAFTSSLYLAGLVASLAASPVTRHHGRRTSILCGGLSFIAGATLNASAQNLAMLLLGRILLGVGIGFGNQIRDSTESSQLAGRFKHNSLMNLQVEFIEFQGQARAKFQARCIIEIEFSRDKA